jgi:hypothetical protein
MLPDAAASPAARALQTPLGRVAVETAGCTVGDAPGVRMQ